MVFGEGDQIGDEHGRPLVAVERILLHQSRHDVSESPRHVGTNLIEGGGLRLLVLEQFLHHRAVGKRRAAGERVEDGAAQRIQVASHVGGARVAGLLRRDVVEGSQRHAAHGQIAVLSHLGQPRKPHVDDASAARGGDDDV